MVHLASRNRARPSRAVSAAGVTCRRPQRQADDARRASTSEMPPSRAHSVHGVTYRPLRSRAVVVRHVSPYRARPSRAVSAAGATCRRIRLRSKRCNGRAAVAELHEILNWELPRQVVGEHLVILSWEITDQAVAVEPPVISRLLTFQKAPQERPKRRLSNQKVQKRNCAQSAWNPSRRPARWRCRFAGTSFTRTAPLTWHCEAEMARRVRYVVSNIPS